MRKAVALAIILLLALGQAQSPQSTLRVLVLPFDAERSFEAYGLGLATGLQRSLNSIDGVYAPSVAEGGLFVRRAFDAGLEAVDTATEAFGAQVVVSGAVSGSGETVAVTLAFAGPRFPEGEQVTLEVPSEPAAAVAGVVEEVATRLGKNDPATLELLADLAAETPELASLTAVSRATTRLGAELADLAAAAQLEPESSWVQAEYARALALSGRNSDALLVATRATDANPSDVEALVVQGIVADAAGSDVRSRQSYQAALEQNSSHALALVGLAEIAEEREQARALLERAVAAAPRLEEAVLSLARLMPSDQQALQVLRRYSDNLPESVALHRAFVERAIAAGDAAGALSYLRNVVSQPLSASPALYGIAGVLPDSHLEAALALVREGRTAYPDSSGLELTEAELLHRNGQNQEAITLLEGLFERFPESPQVANSLAVALAESGQVERASEVFAAVADESETAQVNLGRALLQAGQARAAVKALEPLVNENPDDAEVHTLYGIALGRIGRVDEAIAALDRALEIDPDADEATRARNVLQQQQRITGGETVVFEGEAASEFEQGLYLLETGETGQAADSFRRALELSGHPLTAFYLGYALHLSGSIREALEHYRVALEEYPESDTVLNNLGYAHLQLGRFDLALDALRRAREANEENPSVFVNLGLTYFGLGRYADALEQWDRAIALDPSLESELADVRSRAREQGGAE